MLSCLQMFDSEYVVINVSFSVVDPANQDGFKALPDDFAYPVDTALKSRQQYFKEGETIASLFLSHVIATTRVHYHDKKEMRSNVRNGTMFIIGTILLDWYICSI